MYSTNFTDTNKNSISDSKKELEEQRSIYCMERGRNCNDDDDDDDDDDDNKIIMPNFRSMCLIDEHQRQPAVIIAESSSAISKHNNNNSYYKKLQPTNALLRNTHVVGSSLGSNNDNNQISSMIEGTNINSSTIKVDDFDTTNTRVGWNQANNNKLVFHRKSPFQAISKYNITIPDGVFEPQAMMKQLQCIFHNLSLQVTYSYSPVTALCTAAASMMNGGDLLEFQVTISKATPKNKNHNSMDNDDDDAYYLLEIDWVSGDSIVFHTYYANAILNQLENGTTHTSVMKKPSWDGNSTTRESLISHQEMFQSLLSQNDNITSSSSSSPLVLLEKKDEALMGVLSMVDGLLSNNHSYESVGHGLQLLLQLTNVNQSGYDTANKVSHIVLLGQQSAGCTKCLQLHEKFISYMKKIIITSSNNNNNDTGSCSSSSSSINDDDEDKMLLDDEQDGIFISKDHALTFMSILTQAIHMLPSKDEIDAFLNRAADFSCDNSLIDYMLRCVSSASTAPHMAYLATHMLAVFYSQGDTDLQMMIRYYAPLIHNANCFGANYHADLEHATSRLLTELGRSVKAMT